MPKKAVSSTAPASTSTSSRARRRRDRGGPRHRTYDIAYATVSTLATAHAKGLPFVMIAPAGVIYGARSIAGIMSGQLADPNGKDFNGKTFGTSGLNTLANICRARGR